SLRSVSGYPEGRPNPVSEHADWGILLFLPCLVNARFWCMSYHIRNVPVFSTIEMSPGCGFTMPRKKPVFSFAASLVAKDDGWPEPVWVWVWVWGMGVRGKGQGPFLCPSREKP